MGFDSVLCELTWDYFDVDYMLTCGRIDSSRYLSVIQFLYHRYCLKTRYV
jgi:hypothetical protein